MMALVASGIEYRHPGGGELFSGIELDVNPGERVAIAALPARARRRFAVSWRDI